MLNQIFPSKSYSFVASVNLCNIEMQLPFRENPLWPQRSTNCRGPPSNAKWFLNRLYWLPISNPRLALHNLNLPFQCLVPLYKLFVFVTLIVYDFVIYHFSNFINYCFKVGIGSLMVVKVARAIKGLAIVMFESFISLDGGFIKVLQTRNVRICLHYWYLHEFFH